MNWHHPDLFFLSLLAGLSMLAGIVALPAIIDECVQRFRRRKPEQGDGHLKKARPLDGLRRDFVRDRLSLTVRAFGGWRRRMKLSVLAVAALAFGVLAWHVVSPASSPSSAATGAVCYCEGCGCKGGPGWRGQNGQCVSRANLTKDCGSPPSTRCTHEGARQVCPSTR